MFLAIVPANNEEQRIGSVVRNLFQHADRIVVVDDGSTDRTADVAKEAGATVLRHEINRGQGAALETGHAYARRMDAEYVLHFDGDGQFDASDIPGALQRLKESGDDILFGSRFLDTRSNVPFVKRVLLLPLARMIDRFLGAPRLSDAHNGFRILGRRALEHIRITQDRMAHATEIPVLAKRHGLTYIEYPVRVSYREYGLGIQGGIDIMKDLFFGRFL